MHPVSLTIEPGPAELLAQARRRFLTLSEPSRRFRAQLGLPIDRPVIMSGHQLAIWHPGILAKWLVTSAFAEHGVAPAWLWVDQDANAFGELRYPVRTPRELLEARTWRFTPTLTGHLPVAAAPAFTPTRAPAIKNAEFATEHVAPAIDRIHHALAAAGERASGAAEQLRLTLDTLLAPLDAPIPHHLFATYLAKTDLFAKLVSRMRSDPRACADAYNAAVAAYPDGHAADVTMLHTGVNHPRGAELPLWHIPLAGRAAGDRRRVHAADLATVPIEELAPRGLFMTGLVRLAGCDVFIHGTGGGGPDGYDRITDLWFARWLGESIAPTAVTTATMRLDLPDPLLPAAADPADLAHARWLAHHARHHPSLIGDPDTAHRKRELVRQIAALPRHDPRRSSLFREMHALLDAANAAHADALAELDRAAETAAARLHNAAVAADRTWPFPLYAPAQLAVLHSRVRRALPAAAAPSRERPAAHGM